MANKFLAERLTAMAKRPTYPPKDAQNGDIHIESKGAWKRTGNEWVSYVPTDVEYQSWVTSQEIRELTEREELTTSFVNAIRRALPTWRISGTYSEPDLGIHIEAWDSAWSGARRHVKQFIPYEVFLEKTANLDVFAEFMKELKEAFGPSQATTTDHGGWQESRTNYSVQRTASTLEEVVNPLIFLKYKLKAEEELKALEAEAIASILDARPDR